jgi:hypothetical protein
MAPKTRQNIKDLLNKSQDHLLPKRCIVSALLGNGDGSTVNVAGKNLYVWVRLHGKMDLRVRAYNRSVATIYNLQVDVAISNERESGIADYEVLWPSKNPAIMGACGVTNDAYLCTHAASHEMQSGTMSRDAISIYQRALAPVRPVAQATPNMTVYVQSGIIDGVSVGGTSPTVVAPVSGARIDLLYADMNDSGTLKIRQGTPTASIYDIPVAPAALPGEFAIAQIRIGSGTTALRESNITDIRSLFTTASSGYYGSDYPSYVDSSYYGSDFFESGLTFNQLTDVPASYGGHANDVVMVKPTEDGLCFTAFTVHDPASLTTEAAAVFGLTAQELDLCVQAANTFFAGPVTGTDAKPAFRTAWMWHTFFFSVEGILSIGERPLRFYVPGTFTIDKVFIAVDTAPTDASILVDVHKNGTTIFTTQSGRPAITTGNFTGESATPDVTTLALNDYLQFGIDQVGSSVAGGNLTVHVRCKQYLQ